MDSKTSLNLGTSDPVIQNQTPLPEYMRVMSFITEQEYHVTVLFSPPLASFLPFWVRPLLECPPYDSESKGVKSLNAQGLESNEC